MQRPNEMFAFCKKLQDPYVFIKKPKISNWVTKLFLSDSTFFRYTFIILFVGILKNHQCIAIGNTLFRETKTWHRRVNFDHLAYLCKLN